MLPSPHGTHKGLLLPDLPIKEGDGGGGGETGGSKLLVRLHQSKISLRQGSIGLVREGLDLAVHHLRLKPLLASPISPRRRQ